MVKIKMGINLNILAPSHFNINSHKAFQSHLREKEKKKKVSFKKGQEHLVQELREESKTCE